MELENQYPPQYVQTTQPDPGVQPGTNVVDVQAAPPARHKGAAIGALIFSLITLVCCPESFMCTIPSCICAIVALNDTGDSSKSLSTLSFIGTGLFYIALVISVAIVLNYLVVCFLFTIHAADYTVWLTGLSFPDA